MIRHMPFVDSKVNTVKSSSLDVEHSHGHSEPVSSLIVSEDCRSYQLQASK